MKIVTMKINQMKYQKDEKNNKLFCIIDDCNKIFSNKTSIVTLKNHIFYYHGQTIYKNIKNNNIVNNII